MTLRTYIDHAIRDGAAFDAVICGCDVQQTFHVLEIIEGFETSAKTGEWTKLQSVYHRTPAMVRPQLKGILD